MKVEPFVLPFAAGFIYDDTAGKVVRYPNSLRHTHSLKKNCSGILFNFAAVQALAVVRGSNKSADDVPFFF